MTLPLHIFEPRYREMINACLTERQPFGVVLIQDGSETGRPATPHRTGTLGAISRVERLPDGRLNIEVIGQERFRILNLHQDRAYLTGTVEPFPLEAGDETFAAACARRLAPRIARYLQLLGQAADRRLEQPSMPARPAALAYLGAIVLQAPLSDKQALLNAATVEEMLDREHFLYGREISLVRAMLANPQARHDPDLSPN